MNNSQSSGGPSQNIDLNEEQHMSQFGISINGFCLQAEGNNPSSPGRIATGSTISDPDFVSEEGGRTFQYYKQGKYFLPNDGVEQNRLDLQHEMFRILLDGALAAAPIVNPGYVLDIATGTGLWAIDFAEENQASRVIGTDLSKIQPSRLDIPNCSFIREDSEDPWVFPWKFDYIHLRQVCTCFADTKVVIKQAFDNMNEGGWIEFQDSSVQIMSLDGTTQGTRIERWSQLMGRGLMALGRDANKARFYKQWLEEAGFVDVVENKYPFPIGPWPTNPKFKKLGSYNLTNVHEGFSGISLKVLAAAGLSGPETDELVTQALEDASNPQIHALWPIWIVYGRKPFPWETKYFPARPPNLRMWPSEYHPGPAT
ncbi:S-adenosyl-L-methionine-dependent methyltransferase [Pseudomassariella vexata]|uniref:S-adenosyl-L-methionine-dependent methyltransferase n=1 Tax=Pseudomassariella vexata TaxID=1141098 RepID=A0A1Y2E038_9PEZI|nr:S-adenosyl-L-methionine-dependent methyltransferase [Pseudomassariella vexata]ORY64908.1 S-adenosyl-L-methionine-dependent methyltransferase [Pseudomassariella vexata]